ncbi:hypothetical protein [Streptomyces sp. NPDC053560]
MDRHVHGLLADDPVPHTRVTSALASKADAVQQALRLFLQEAAA